MFITSLYFHELFNWIFIQTIDKMYIFLIFQNWFLCDISQKEIYLYSKKLKFLFWKSIIAVENEYLKKKMQYANNDKKRRSRRRERKKEIKEKTGLKLKDKTMLLYLYILIFLFIYLFKLIITTISFTLIRKFLCGALETLYIH